MKFSFSYRLLAPLRGITLLLASSFVVGPRVLAAGSPQSYDDLISEARADLRSGKAIEALVVARQALLMNTNRYEAYGMAGLAFLQTGVTSDAALSFKSALQKAPESKRKPLEDLLKVATRETDFNKFAAAGFSAAENGEYASASDTFYAAWQLCPDRPQVAMQAATLSMAADRYDRARPVLQSLLAQPDSPKEVKQEAQALLAKAEKVMSVRYQGWLALAADQFRQQLPEGALSASRQAVAYYPDRPAGLIACAEAETALDRKADAISHVREAIKLGFSDWRQLAKPGPFSRIASDPAFAMMVEKSFGQKAGRLVRACGADSWRERVSQLETLAKDFPGDADVGECLREAQNSARVALPQAQASAEKAASALQTGNVSQAVISFRAAVENEPDNPSRYADLAEALMKGQHAVEAETVIREALKLDPRNGLWKAKLAEIQMSGHKWREAAESWETAIAAEPKNAEFHDGYGRALFSAGEKEKAAQEFQKATTLDPDSKTYAAHAEQARPK